MNERIFELAESCTVDFVDGRGVSLSEIDVEKFAELIVRECVGIADEYDGVGSTIVSRIKKHFGVER